jgi:YD repeat-containing protein
MDGQVKVQVTFKTDYEATGLVTNKVYADGKGPSYTYTPDGKIATRTWARGVVTTYTYDNSGALTNMVYSDDTPTISLAYNRAGRQIEAHDAAGVTTFLYDDFGAVTNETVIGVAGTNTIERFYDSFGRSLGYALNDVRQSTLAYDPAMGRLASMLANGSDTPFTWNYLAGSDLKSSLAYPNGLTASWQYDANSQLLQVKNAFPTNTISQYDYVYDAAGRRVQISRSGSAMSENRTDVYGYNERGELISAAKNAEGANMYCVNRENEKNYFG